MNTEQPSSIEEIIMALENAIARDGKSSRGDIASKIAYGILYGNNKINLQQLFAIHPELEIIAETALEFDHQSNPQYLQECWNIIISNIKILKSKSREANR